MAFKFFSIPIQNGEAAEVELNTFLRSHTVLCVDRRWVDQGPTSFWSFCIDYLDPNSTRGSRQRGNIDYREVLNEEDFAVRPAPEVLPH